MDQKVTQRIDNHIETNLRNHLHELAVLCAQPSVSAQKLGIDECADLVAVMLRARGFDSKVMQTDGSPIVYAEASGRSDKTMLLYLHYDVQPPEPLALWESPPWELTKRGDHLYARGVADDKGHIIARMAALDALVDVYGELPCNIKFVIEGEEEVGSPSIYDWVGAHKEMLSADACIWEFGGVNHDGVPVQSLGLRGICYIELSTRTATRDIHSGLGGTIFPNASWRLVWALQSLKDAHEHITIPGWYDDVVEPSDVDMQLLAALPDETQEWREMFGLDHFLNGYTGGVDMRRAAVFEPAATICGLDSGYQGVGAKTIIPARAAAKVDFRLVPNQHPTDLLQKLRKHLDAQGFEDIEIRFLGGYPAAKTAADDPFVQLTNAAAHAVYGVPPLVQPMVGGSGPMSAFVEHLHVPVVTCGIGEPGSRAHAPNENISLPQFLNGVRHTAQIIGRFADSD
jgi:acetylornithine deacetylase/succinyl-diaminopimelate desuccinylase-like protein